MLTPANEDAKELTQLCQGRFTGDPGHEFEVTKFTIVNENTDEESIEEQKVKSKFFDFVDDRFLFLFCCSSPYVKKNDYQLHCRRSKKMLSSFHVGLIFCNPMVMFNEIEHLKVCFYPISS